MFSLIEFDNGEVSVVSSKRVKIIQGEDCIVKWSGGASYHAQLIQASNDKDTLLKLKKQQVNGDGSQISIHSNSDKHIDNSNIRKANDTDRQLCRDLKINLVALNSLSTFLGTKSKKRSSQKKLSVANDPNDEQKKVFNRGDELSNADNNKTKTSRNDNLQTQNVQKEISNTYQSSDETNVSSHNNNMIDKQCKLEAKSLVNDNSTGETSSNRSDKVIENYDSVNATNVAKSEDSSDEGCREQDLQDKLSNIKCITEESKVLIDNNDAMDNQPTSTLTAPVNDNYSEKIDCNNPEKLSKNNDPVNVIRVDEPNVPINLTCQQNDFEDLPADLSIEHVPKLSKPRNSNDENNTGGDSTSSGSRHTPKCRIIEDINVSLTKHIRFSTPKMNHWTESSELHDSSLPLLNNLSCILGDQSHLSFSFPNEMINISRNDIPNVNDPDKKISLHNFSSDQGSVDETNNSSDMHVEKIIHSGNDTSDLSFVPSDNSHENAQEKSLEKSSASDKSTFDSTPSLDIQKLSVLSTTAKLKDSAVKTTKSHFCPFCKKLQTKFSRHLILKHADEDDVKKFLYLPKKSQERKKLIASIRKRGDFLHNTLPEFNTGILIVPRQRQSKSVCSAEDYIPCKNCKLFLSKTSIRFHIPFCDMSHQKGSRTVLQNGRRLAGYIHPCASETLRRTIFPVFKDDMIVRCIKYDEIIIKFGNKLCEKYTLTHQHDHIRAQLRLLGRLRIEMMILDKTIDEFKSIFSPKQFDNVINSIKIVASWNEQIMWYDHPSVAQNLTTLVKKCAKTLRVECIKSEDNNRKSLVENFLLLWEEEVPTTINKKALEDQIAQKRPKKVILPSKSDIKLLYDYLQEQCFICLEILTNEFQKDAWFLLIQSTLILVQIFNRRRAGEIERLTLIDYENKTSLNENVDPEIYNKLSNNTREYAAQYKRLTIRGKRGRTVPVLLSPIVVKCIDLILKYRNEAKIPSSNKYIFSKPCGSKLSKLYFRACPLMRRFANDCGALIPSALRGTTLRKHIATYTAMLNIEESQVDRLANFMGHDKDIHKSIYRMPVPVAEITDVSRLLMSAIGDDVEESNEASDEENSDSSDDDMNNGNDDPELDTHQNTNKRKASHTLISENGETYKRIKTEFAHTASHHGKTRQKWSDSEKEAVTKYFGDILMLPKLPSLQECQTCISMNRKILHNRSAEQLKTWIDNQRRAKDRKRAYASNKRAKQ